MRDGRASAAQLAKHTLLLREAGSSTRAIAERALALAGYQPAKRWELDSNEAIKRSVAAGLGVGFVSRRVVEDELARGELESFLVQGAGSMRRAVFRLRPDGRELRPAERAFVETLCSAGAAPKARPRAVARRPAPNQIEVRASCAGRGDATSPWSTPLCRSGSRPGNSSSSIESTGWITGR